MALQQASLRNLGHGSAATSGSVGNYPQQ